MCLGIPAKLLEVSRQDDLPMGKVEFGGIVKDVCLAYTPEARVGDYVLVHVGFAISVIDETEAQEIFGYLEEIGNASREDDLAMESPAGGQMAKDESLPAPPNP
jgi:hydrogenase expression/formation protein HypC